MRSKTVQRTAFPATLLCLTFFLNISSTTADPRGEPRVDRNIVYGMYSGLALLMDVHYPSESNGYGVIFISGSGWHAPLSLDARGLKESRQVEVYVPPLTEAGYTVFSINHRAAPRFRYPAAVEDAQRAVRYVRHHAARFGIRPDRIGATGGSSGGHLVSMLGALDGAGDTEDSDEVSRESAKVQCVVARAAPADLAKLATDRAATAATSFLGIRLPPQADAQSEEARQFAKASPINGVSGDDPPFLLMHGDADETVPFEQSELMHAALERAGVEVKLLRIPGGAHGATFGGVTDGPDYLGEMVRWFDHHLQRQQARQ